MKFRFNLYFFRVVPSNSANFKVQFANSVNNHNHVGLSFQNGKLVRSFTPFPKAEHWYQNNFRLGYVSNDRGQNKYRMPEYPFRLLLLRTKQQEKNNRTKFKKKICTTMCPPFVIVYFILLNSFTVWMFESTNWMAPLKSFHIEFQFHMSWVKEKKKRRKEEIVSKRNFI